MAPVYIQYEKEVYPFPRATSDRALPTPALAHALISLGSQRDRVDPAGRAKVFISGNVGPARCVALPSQKGDPAKRVSLLAEPTFCFSTCEHGGSS